MFVIDKTVEINAPAEVVWEVITDFASYSEWNPFIVECKSTLKPGDPIDLKVKLFSFAQPQREWVKEFVPGRRFAYTMKAVPLGTLSSQRSHDLMPAGDKTRYQSYFHLDGWLMPVVRAIMGSRIARGFEGMTNGIKTRSEHLWQQRGSGSRP